MTRNCLVMNTITDTFNVLNNLKIFKCSVLPPLWTTFLCGELDRTCHWRVWTPGTRTSSGTITKTQLWRESGVVYVNKYRSCAEHCIHEMAKTLKERLGRSQSHQPGVSDGQWEIKEAIGIRHQRQSVNRSSDPAHQIWMLLADDLYQLSKSKYGFWHHRLGCGINCHMLTICSREMCGKSTVLVIQCGFILALNIWIKLSLLLSHHLNGRLTLLVCLQWHSLRSQQTQGVDLNLTSSLCIKQPTEQTPEKYIASIYLFIYFFHKL